MSGCMPLHHRQGDLLFLWQNTRPQADLPPRLSNVIVAGEPTGHAHGLTAGTVLEAPEGTLCLDLHHAAEVVHEEQYPITLDSGPWRMVRQREFSPQAIGTVQD